MIFFRPLLSNCVNWKTYCDDHSSHSSSSVAVIARCSCLVIVAAVIVAGFPVLFMYFSCHLVPTFNSRDLSSEHVMARVGKRCVCVCDSLEVTTN